MELLAIAGGAAATAYQNHSRDKAKKALQDFVRLRFATAKFTIS